VDFHPVAVDLNPELSNPLIAISFTICCALFAAVIVAVVRSKRPQGRKVLLLVTALLVGSLGAKMLPQVVNGLVAWVHFVRLGQHPSIGVIGESPSFWLAPSVAIAAAIVALGVIAIWRRVDSE